MAGMGMLIMFDLKTLSQQMTYIESELFSRIRISELFHKNFEKRQRSPFLSAAIDRTNQVTSWVMTDVLRCRDERFRATAIGRWLDLAKIFKDMNNYVSLLQIMTALHNSSIQRLKLTWRHVCSSFYLCVCVLFVCCLYIVCVLFVYCLYIVCVLFVHCLCMLCM
jgi:hypothetical protein